MIFPTTIRRRILRHLYLRQVRNAYLFKGVRQKFIDALLGVARIELFMPQARPCTLTPSQNLALLAPACIHVPPEAGMPTAPVFPAHSNCDAALLLPAILTDLT